jgi:hypothetical protein
MGPAKLPAEERKFGGKNPSLKAIARTPEIPELARGARRLILDEEKRELEAANWLGLQLK